MAMYNNVLPLVSSRVVRFIEKEMANHMSEKYLSENQAQILMASLILARSTSYVMTKIALNELTVFNLLGIRFLLAFLMLLPFMWKKLKAISVKTLIRGIILGTVASMVMAAEVTGLKTADASTAAFLENTAVIFVPIFEAIIKRRLPQKIETISAIIAMIGIALLTLKGGTFRPSIGELFCLSAAILYAFAIIITDRLSHEDDPLIIGVLQVFFMGIFSMILSLITENPALPQMNSTWYAVIALTVICTCFGFTLQPMAQSRLTAERASLFCAIGPIGGALAGWICLGETINIAGFWGMVLIILGVILTTFQKKIP